MATFADVFEFSDYFLIHCRPYRVRKEDRNELWQRYRALVLQIQQEYNRPDFEDVVVNTPDKVILSTKSQLAFAALELDFEELLRRPPWWWEKKK